MLLEVTSMKFNYFSVKDFFFYYSVLTFTHTPTHKVSRVLKVFFSGYLLSLRRTHCAEVKRAGELESFAYFWDEFKNDLQATKLSSLYFTSFSWYFLVEHISDQNVDSTSQLYSHKLFQVHKLRFYTKRTENIQQGVSSLIRIYK